jgi:hypothetical protein
VNDKQAFSTSFVAIGRKRKSRADRTVDQRLQQAINALPMANTRPHILWQHILSDNSDQKSKNLESRQTQTQWQTTKLINKTRQSP